MFSGENWSPSKSQLQIAVILNILKTHSVVTTGEIVYCFLAGVTEWAINFNLFNRMNLNK